MMEEERGLVVVDCCSLDDCKRLHKEVGSGYDQSRDDNASYRDDSGSSRNRLVKG